MDHYFTNNKDLKSNMQMMKISVINNDYFLYTDNGVFSKSNLDFGTRFLIECLPLPQMHGKALDVGCGYGPIGIVIKKETDCIVDMVDINTRALHLAKLNAKENKALVNIFESDAYSNVHDKYNYIITNPPIRAGKKKVYEILIGAHDFLEDDGELWFVMRKDHGVKSALSDLGKYYEMSISGKEKGFFVICAKKRAEKR